MKDNPFNKAGYGLPKWWMLILLLAVALQFKVNAAYPNQIVTAITGQIQPGASPDTLVFYYFRDYLYGSVGVEEVAVRCDEKGRFHFSVPNAALIGRISIVVKGSSTSYLLDHYLQQGDAIILNGKRTTYGLEFRFSGEGAAKFNLKQQLDSVSAQSVKKMRNIPELQISPVTDEYAKLSTIFKRLDYTAKLQIDLLKEKEIKLPRQIYNLMSCDVSSYALERKYFNYRFFAGRNKEKPNYGRFLGMFYELEASAVVTVNDALFRISKNYLELLISSAQVRDFVYGEQGLQQTYRLLKYASPLALRSRVLTSYLLSSPKSEKPGVYQECVTDARKSAADSIDLRVLDQLLAAYHLGSKVIDFELIKQDGSTFRSSEVLGKVVLVDFWFTGCTACIKQTSEFNLHVIPKIKVDNKSVIILSVNLDKKLQDWKQSLATGKYSIEGSLELFTGGLAFNHPLAKFYQIQSCPRLLVFDQTGHLIASDPNIETVLSLIDELAAK